MDSNPKEDSNEKILVFFLSLVLILSTVTPTYAHGTSHDRQFPYEEIERRESENISTSSTLPAIFVTLTVKVSHYNAHKSYDKIVTRQGKKYRVVYQAIPRSDCYLCKYNSY